MYRIQLDPGPWAQYVKRADNIGLPLHEVSKKYMMESNLYATQLFESLQQQQSMQSAVSAGGSAPASTPSTPHVEGVDFTIEWFINANAWGSHPRPFSLGAYPAPNAVSIEGSGNDFYWWTNGSFKVNASSLNLHTGSWYHMAVTRNNGVLGAYINGQLLATGSYTASIPAGNNNLTIGAEPGDSYVNGYITNFRWTADVLYTGASFTVPTSPLTATANTKLLLLATTGSSAYTDSSALAQTVTNVSSSWNNKSPFSGSVGGSISFNGTSAYITVPSGSVWNL